MYIKLLAIWQYHVIRLLLPITIPEVRERVYRLSRACNIIRLSLNCYVIHLTCMQWACLYAVIEAN